MIVGRELLSVHGVRVAVCHPATPRHVCSALTKPSCACTHPQDDAEDFNAWLGELPHAHKVVVEGNHEYVNTSALHCATRGAIRLGVCACALVLLVGAAVIKLTKSRKQPKPPF